MAPKKTLKPKAIAAIQTMIAYVLSHPKEYDQGSFPSTESDAPVCNTAYCAAGHIVAHQFPEKFKRLLKRQWLDAKNDAIDSVQWDLEALKVLGLKPKSEDMYRFFGYDKLFGTTGDWPEKFFNQYKNAKGPKGRAKAFANLWNEFISVDGDLDKLGSTRYENRYGI
jgi:hypothetical protein